MLNVTEKKSNKHRFCKLHTRLVTLYLLFFSHEHIILQVCQYKKVFLLSYTSVIHVHDDPGVNQQVQGGGVTCVTILLDPPPPSTPLPLLSHWQWRARSLWRRSRTIPKATGLPDWLSTEVSQAPQAGGSGWGRGEQSQALLIDSLSFHWGGFVVSLSPQWKRHYMVLQGHTVHEGSLYTHMLTSPQLKLPWTGSIFQRNPIFH